MSSVLESPALIKAMNQLIVVMQVAMDMLMNPACNVMMTGKMGTRGAKTVTVKELARKSRRKTIKAPGKRTKSPMRRMNSKSSVHNEPAVPKLPARNKKIQHRRPSGGQCDKSPARPMKNKPTTKMLSNYNNEEMATPKKRVRRPAPKTTVPRMKKNVIRHARQTTRKRAAGTRQKAALGKNARVC